MQISVRPPFHPALHRPQQNLVARLKPSAQALESFTSSPPTFKASPSPLKFAAAKVKASPEPSGASATQELEKLIAQALSDPKAEKQLLDTLELLNATGQLKPLLSMLVESAAATGKLPPMPEAKQQELVNQAAGMIDAQFRERGLTPDTKGVVYKDWDQLSQEHLAAVRQTQTPPRTPGGLSAFTNPTFIKELEALQGAKFRGSTQVRPLIDGPASFAERDRLIDSAQSSIYLMTWAFYDDTTGWDTARKLVEKAKEGVDVKVLVDGQVSHQLAHDAPIKFLEDHGIPVVRWADPKRPYDGNHRKMMIVDAKEAIAGGLNIGDVYSHRAGTVKWRDTDVAFTGAAVADGTRLFGSLWNEQVRGTSKAAVMIPAEPIAPATASTTAVVNHVPGPEGDGHIMLATMKAIEGATESVDIENAYFISTPGLKDVLLKALADGVKVRILTNSAESIDEPLISGPILASLPELVAAGAEVYLKKGDTLHSKFMICDGIFSSVGSHNHHPRSQRFEGEMVVNSLDSHLASALKHSFEADIAAAQPITDPQQIQVPDSPLALLASRYFFDAL